MVGRTADDAQTETVEAAETALLCCFCPWLETTAVEGDDVEMAVLDGLAAVNGAEDDGVAITQSKAVVGKKYSDPLSSLTVV